MAKKASDHIRYYRNAGGPTISTVSRPVIEADGLYFKDIDGTGKVSPVNDWRRDPSQRAAAYVREMTVDEKIAQLFISDWRMGPKYPSMRLPGHVIVPDESGVLDDAEVHQKTIFGEQHLPGTTTLIKEWFSRHTILRENAQPEDLTDYLNQLQAVAEECARFVPVQAASNSRNENGAIVFGMNDAGGVFPTWPGTLGIAAAVRGSGIEVADRWAEAIRRSWEACNLRKGYMYMVDCMTDPRWQRSYGTFGEDPALICRIAEHIIPRIQGSDSGVTDTGVAVTTKHFPGGGPVKTASTPTMPPGSGTSMPQPVLCKNIICPASFPRWASTPTPSCPTTLSLPQTSPLCSATVPETTSDLIPTVFPTTGYSSTISSEARWDLRATSTPTRASSKT